MRIIRVVGTGGAQYDSRRAVILITTFISDAHRSAFGLSTSVEMGRDLGRDHCSGESNDTDERWRWWSFASHANGRTGSGSGRRVLERASDGTSGNGREGIVERCRDYFVSDIVVAPQGRRASWARLTPCRTMSIPSSAIYMLGYEYLLEIISPYFTGTNDPAANASSLNRKVDASGNIPTTSLTPAPLVAGSLARTLSATAISPIEMFRTRLQALPNGQSSV